MIAFWDGGNGKNDLHSAIYSGGSWSAIQTFNSAAVGKWSAVSYDNSVYLVWEEAGKVYLREYDGTSWNVRENVAAVTTGSQVQISVTPGYQAIYWSDASVYVNASYRFGADDYTVPKPLVQESDPITDISVSVTSTGDKIGLAYDITSTKQVKFLLDDVPASWRPAWTTNPVTSVIRGQQYSYTPALNESAPIEVVTMPEWMTFSGGTLSGTPSATGEYQVALRATSSMGGMTSFQSYIVSVRYWGPAYLNTPSYMAKTDFEYRFEAKLNESATVTLTTTLPGWLSWDGQNLTGTPGINDIGVSSISLLASNGPGGGSTPLVWTITVQDRDRWIPLISSNPGTSVEVARPYLYQLVANESVSVQYSGPGWLAWDGASMTLSGTAPNTPQTVHVALKITSVAGTLAIWQNVTITVTAAPPHIDPVPPIVVPPGESYGYSFGGSGWGEGGDRLLHLDNPPDYVDYDPVNGTVTITPPIGLGGINQTITGTVTNTTTGVSTPIEIPISIPPADPPEIGSGHQGTPPGSSDPVDMIWTDTPYSYVLIVSPSRCTVTMTTDAAWLQYSDANRTAWGTPLVPGTHHVSLRIYDPATTLVSYDNWTLIVTAPPPVIGSSATFHVLTNDPWSYVLVYTPVDAIVNITGLPDWMTWDNATHTFSGTPHQAGTYSYVIVLTNATSGMGARQTVTVIVDDDAPNLLCNPPRTGQERVLYRWTASADQSVVWSISGDAGAWLVIDPQTGRVQGTPDAEGVYSVTVTATNDRGISSSYSYELTVKPYSSGGSQDGSNDSGGTITLPGGIEIPIGGTASLAVQLPVIALVIVLIIILLFFFRRRDKK
jgi:hypothetical protein